MDIERFSIACTVGVLLSLTSTQNNTSETFYDFEYIPIYDNLEFVRNPQVQSLNSVATNYFKNKTHSVANIEEIINDEQQLNMYSKSNKKTDKDKEQIKLNNLTQIKSSNTEEIPENIAESKDPPEITEPPLSPLQAPGNLNLQIR